jgi:hypothetical protein
MIQSGGGSARQFHPPEIEMLTLGNHAGRSRFCRRVGVGLAWLCVILLSVWATAALYFDIPTALLRAPAAAAYLLVIVGFIFLIKRSHIRIVASLMLFSVVLAWWVSLMPSNSRPWQTDVAQTAWAEVDGDRVTIHNFRECDYQKEFEYTCQWQTKNVVLSEVRGIDLFITYWGSPWIAHPILSFQFGDDDHVAFSIETRKVIGESYSSIRGFFRQYELAYVIADERDVIRLRTNYRQGESVYLYRTIAQPAFSRALFLDYLGRANKLREHPEWFNALTSNCTTNIFAHIAAVSGAPSGNTTLDWRILLNGKGDEMEYERGILVGNLPFQELKHRALINPAAQTADQAPDFSQRIRAGRPGFENQQH